MSLLHTLEGRARGIQEGFAARKECLCMLTAYERIRETVIFSILKRCKISAEITTQRFIKTYPNI